MYDQGVVRLTKKNSDGLYSLKTPGYHKVLGNFSQSYDFEDENDLIR